MREVVILGAARTIGGRFGGSFRDVAPPSSGAATSREEPPNRPPLVRAAPSMTTSLITYSPSDSPSLTGITTPPGIPATRAGTFIIPPTAQERMAT